MKSKALPPRRLFPRSCRQVRYTKAFSVTSSVIGIGLQPYLYTALLEHSPIFKAAMASVVGVFVFVTPLLIHSVTRRYVTDMYYDPVDMLFTVDTLTLLVRRRREVFSAGQVNSETAVASMFSNFEVNGRPLLIDPSCFSDRDAYIKLMGYDKPIDLNLKPSDSDEDDKDKTKN